MKKRFLLFGFIMVATVLVGAACAGPEGPAGPAGPAGPQGKPGVAAEAPMASVDSIVAGGLLYDKWWKVDTGAMEPSEDNPLWALQTLNTRSGADTWRCKECHGWDYKGIGGAYAGGSHKTGFPGVYDASLTKNRAQLLEALNGGTNSKHDLSSVMSDTALENLADFIGEGLVNDVKYIDYATKKTIGADLANGEKLYGSVCAACHGADGKTIDIDGAGVGAIANGNPWESLHKIRFGHPGSGMPSAVKSGWSTQESVDTLAYSQTLPE